MKSRITYANLLKAVCDRIGLQSSQLSAIDAAKIHRDICTRLEYAWNYRFWPELTLVEQRWFADSYETRFYDVGNKVYHFPTDAYYIMLDPGGVALEEPGTGDRWALLAPTYSASDWVTGQDYAAGDRVRYNVNGGYYQLWLPDPGNYPEPVEDSGLNWGPLEPFNKTITWAATGQTEIGLVRNCWTKHPDLTKDAQDVNYVERPAGVCITDNVTSTWIEFLTPAPELTGDPYDAAATYDPGDQVYYDTDFYNCIKTTSAGDSPDTDPDKWTVVELPYLFRDYIAQAVYADWLSAEADLELRNTELVRAETVLASLAMRVIGTERQTRRTVTLTR